MGPGWLQILLVVVLVLVLFGGRGKISSLMGDVAKGIKSFRTGLSDSEKEESGDADSSGATSSSAKVIEHEPREGMESSKAEKHDASRHGS